MLISPLGLSQSYAYVFLITAQSWVVCDHCTVCIALCNTKFTYTKCILKRKKIIMRICIEIHFVMYSFRMHVYSQLSTIRSCKIILQVLLCMAKLHTTLHSPPLPAYCDDYLFSVVCLLLFFFGQLVVIPIEQMSQYSFGEKCIVITILLDCFNFVCVLALFVDWSLCVCVCVCGIFRVLITM